MRGKQNCKCNISLWKEKAKERSILIQYQKKRIKELQGSRDRWREKYFAEKKSRQKKEGEPFSSLSLSRKPKGHSFGISLIRLCLLLRLCSGCSLRSCVDSLRAFGECSGTEPRIPSFHSVRNWEMKSGYHRLFSGRERDGRWALIVDESVSVGNQKLLAVLGVRLDDHDFRRPLSLGDVEVLSLRVSSSWAGQGIREVLDGVRERVPGVAYCCSDNGNNIRKALRDSGLTHVEDCGHALGLWLKHKYAKDAAFIAFNKEASLMRKRHVLGKYAHLVPPRFRTKARFLNLTELSRWGNRLVAMAREDKKTGEVTGWVLEYADFLKTLSFEQELINGVNKVLKSRGLSSATRKECLKLAEESPADGDLKRHIAGYLDRNTAKLPETENLLCSSDIIESFFGKFKYRSERNPNKAITEGCLALACICGNIDINECKDAMEQVKIVDLKNWRKNNLPKTIQQKRNEAFKKAN